ncbi:A24 family peptidase [Castellaniella sp.]|uniref:A24 family peptidase n=1 Tax=Castellaniella sp. TaxID=1955812 RepID=UPI002AFE59EF|nr:A24 family peptidase [Castellaniella sp.]
MGIEFVAYLIPAGLVAWLVVGFDAWSREYTRRLCAGAPADMQTLWAAARAVDRRAAYRCLDCLLGAWAGGMALWLLVDQSWPGLISVVLLLGLLALAWLDLRSGLLPDALTLPLMGLGWCLGPLGLVSAVSASLLIWGGVAGVAWVYGRWRGRAGFGGGDIKYLAMLAAWLGGPDTLTVLWMASLLGILWWAIGWTGRRPAYPFGPCLTLAALPWVLAGPLRDWPDAVLLLGVSASQFLQTFLLR